MENFENDNIDIADLPQYEEAKFHPVLKQYLVKLHIQTLIFFGIVIFSLGSWYFFTGSLFLYPAIIFFVLYFLFRFWNNYMLQKTLGFALREKDILYRRGYIVSRTTVVPFNRIQHASISRDVLDKMLNLASLEVFTAGGSGSDINIPGLDPQMAQKLKESLAVKISEDEN